MGDFDSGRACVHVGNRDYGKSLHALLNFGVNLKLKCKVYLKICYIKPKMFEKVGLKLHRQLLYLMRVLSLFFGSKK